MWHEGTSITLFAYLIESLIVAGRCRSQQVYLPEGILPGGDGVYQGAQQLTVFAGAARRRASQ